MLPPTRLRLSFLLLLTLTILKITTSTSISHPLPPQPPPPPPPPSSNLTDPEPLFTLQIELDDALATLTITENDDPEEAVLIFCSEHGLDSESYDFLISEVLESGVFEVEEDSDEDSRHHNEYQQQQQQQQQQQTAEQQPLLEIIYQIPVSDPEGRYVGAVQFTEFDEPADVAYNFVKHHNLDPAYKNLILENACELIECERIEAIIFNLNIDLGLESDTTLTIYEDEDARSEIIHFCEEYDIGEEGFDILIEEVRNEGIQILDPERIIWRQNVQLEAGVDLGTVEVRAGEEAVDVISNFLYENLEEEKMSLYDKALTVLTEHACKAIACSRTQPLIWSEEVEDEEGNLLGVVEVFEGVEPIDAIAQFTNHFQLGEEYRDAILEACCEEVDCVRSRPRVFHQRISDENGRNIGTLEILENQEVVDAVVKFVMDKEVTLDLIALKNHFFQSACDSPGTVCTRNVAKLWEKNIVNADKTELGMLAIMEDREPVDQIWDFLNDKIEDEVARANFFFNMKPVVCEGKYVRCNREAPLVFGPQPISGPEGGTVGHVSIMLGEEPIDATYKFFSSAGLFEKGWDFRAVFNQICGLEGVEGRCIRQEALKYSKKNASVDGVEIGDMAVWEHEEVIDVCYRKRLQYNLTINQQMMLFNDICKWPEVYCSRSRAAMLTQVVNKHDYDYEEYADNNSTCPRKYCGWRFISGWEGIMMDKVIPWMNKDGSIGYFKDPRFVLGMLLGLAWVNRILVFVLFKVPFVRRFRKRAKSLGMKEWAILFSGAMLYCSFIYSRSVEPTNEIDSAMHAFMGKMEGPLEVLEGEQVADAVLQWAIKEEKKHHPLLRKHIYWSLIDDACAKKTELSLEVACKRRKAYEKLDLGAITYWGMEHKITYWKNPNATMEEELDAGRVEDAADEICERLVPPMNNCNEDIATHIMEQYENFEENRQEQKSVYAKVGVCADATAGEIYIAAGKTFNRLGSNYVPYARVDNGTTDGWTTTYHPWDMKTKQAETIMNLLPQVLVEKDREWYDKPCEPVFGGAMCAKKDAKGNMMIEMG